MGVVHIVDPEGDMVDADHLLTGCLMNLEYRLIIPRRFQLRGFAVMLGMGQELEAELLQEFDVLVEVPHDELNMVDAAYHGRLT